MKGGASRAVAREKPEPIQTVRQQTLAGSVSFSGIGVHSGTPARATLRPAAAGSGVAFYPVDSSSSAAIPAVVAAIADSRRATSLAWRGAPTVSTTEHLLAALSGLGIDNVRVEISGPELPIMDGSAASFVFLIDAAGIVEQDLPRRYIRILRTLECSEDGAWIRASALPGSEGCWLTYRLRPDDRPVIKRGPLSATVRLSPSAFRHKVARARTFGFLSDLKRERENGRALGAGLENAIALGRDQVLNEEGLRFDDELAMHKILDMVGDLALLGGPLIGSVEGYGSGHALNHRLLRKLLEERDAWEYCEVPHVSGGGEKSASALKGL